MSTYLYTWNPNNWKWVDLQDAIFRVNNGEEYNRYWSCGVTKKIAPGDMFILVRLGVEPKGIIGVGYVTSAPYLRPHWDETRKAAGETALRTDLLYKALSEKPIISMAELSRRFPQHNWTPQSSGTSIPEDIAAELIAEIQSDQRFNFEPSTKEQIKLYSEGRPKTVTYKTYDRSSDAREDCIRHHGYNCAVCGFNFEATYGSTGEGFIEVHHLRQIADRGEEHLVDPVKDLRPVCANCHRMLHKTRPPLGIEELRLKISGK